MSYKIVYDDAAHADVIDAYVYYEEQRKGLGERFLKALVEIEQQLSRHPHSV